jgi:predicted house-cleaning noncanonical NTP pyrophosphatase (MazG superfamily)
MSKLVRDRIPEICRANGQDPIIRQASFTERMPLLLDKLTEETNEVRDAGPVERATELADVLEVTYALAEAIGLSREGLEEIREARHAERGGFDLGLVWYGNRQQPDRERGR